VVKVDFDNGYIVPLKVEDTDRGKKIECSFYEYGKYHHDLTLEVFVVEGDSIKEIIENAVEEGEYEVY